MGRYLLIESRDPFESGDVRYFCLMAKDLASNGNQVAVFLVQNGVFMARQGLNPNPLSEALGNGKVEVLADEFCLRERAIQPSALAHGVKVSDVGHLVDLLTQDGVKAVWH